MTKIVDIIEVYNVKNIANFISSENKPFIKPSNEGMRNILPITKKKIVVILIVIEINIISNFDLIISNIA
jgi:hypothetical protein